MLGDADLTTSIRTGAAEVQAEQAFELMEMIDGIYASSELGREVPVA